MDVRHHGYDDECLVRSVLQEAFPTERPIFSQRRGEQIIRAAALEALERPDRHRPFVGGRVAALVAAAFTLVAGTAGVAGAALPGQRLYPVKQAVERAMVAIAGDDVQAAQLELRFAERRLAEAAVTAREQPDLAPAIAERYHEHVNAAVQLGGDEIIDELDRLEQSRTAAEATPQPVISDVEKATGTQTSKRSPAPVEKPASTPTPAPSTQPSPLPSPSPSPPPPDSDITPIPLVEPSPLPSPPPTPDLGQAADDPEISVEIPVIDDDPAGADD